MTAWERLQECGPLRPLGSPCRICGNDPEQRHRVWDALTDRWQAGESLVEVAADYEVTPDDVAAVMVAQGEWLTAEARWWAERLLTARPERVAGPPEWVRTLSPAAEHALLVDHPCTAAAIHVLDGIESGVFPREAVTMAGVDWAAIAEVRPMLSSGEQTLTDAAEDLDLVGQVGGLTLAEVRQRVDRDGNRRVRDAMVMVGQTVPVRDREFDGDRLVGEDQAREGFWDRYARGDR